MKRAGVGLTTLIATCFLPSPAFPQVRDRVAEVEAAVRAFAGAFEAAEASLLDTLLTRDYIHINGRSGDVLTKDDWLRWVRSRRVEIDAGQLTVGVYRIRELTVRVYGDAAVVTGIVHSSGMRGGGPFSSRVRFTNLWVFERGRWRRAAFHDSPLDAETR